ncbi:MAG: SDR family oxidoreductase [Hyphomicrobiales bacterium]|nr:SDR family oxidoreductase [Hyphomicrobiales bacterium]MDE2016654.1 SDR family oxidoreductase [Hyphomicrobiales bacterium]
MADPTPTSSSNAAAPPLPKLPKLLPGQKALVTGANSGIGKAVVLAMAEAGADVAVNYVVGDDPAQEVVAAAQAFGVKAKAYKADVSDEGQVKAMYAAMVADFGTIDVLVANAGLQRDAAIDDMTLAQWNTVIQVNLTGQFLCAREAIREFKRRGINPAVSRSAGKIICMSSVHQQIPWAGHVNYASSKGGILMLMQSLAQECAPHRIRINSIAPGAIRTPINTAAWDTPAAYDKLMGLVPYGRIGEPDDIGHVAVWLASDHSDYVVGATLFVDGGMTLYPGFATNG